MVVRLPVRVPFARPWTKFSPRSRFNTCAVQLKIIKHSPSFNSSFINNPANSGESAQCALFKSNFAEVG
jgi:hypothetical protein